MDLKESINYEKITENCIQWIRDYFEKNGKDCNAVIGLSGGKDSTVVASLCVKALGKDRVIGVAMPDVLQGLNDADNIAEYLGIKFINAPIGRIVHEFKNFEFIPYSNQAIQNIPPRVRMTMLYAIAQSYNGRVSCNCNLSEDWIGYSTFGGDNLGAFAPLAKLTVTEIINIGKCLGLPNKWVEKKPDDGLPNSAPDEEKFGFSYALLDKYIRIGICEDEVIKNKIDEMHRKNLFKLDIIRVPSFEPELPIDKALI